MTQIEGVELEHQGLDVMNDVLDVVLVQSLDVQAGNGFERTPRHRWGTRMQIGALP